MAAVIAISSSIVWIVKGKGEAKLQLTIQIEMYEREPDVFWQNKTVVQPWRRVSMEAEVKKTQVDLEIQGQAKPPEKQLIQLKLAKSSMLFSRSRFNLTQTLSNCCI